MGKKLPPLEPDANNPQPKSGREALEYLRTRNEARRRGRPLPTMAAVCAQVPAKPQRSKPAPRSTTAERKVAVRKRKQSARGRRRAMDAAKDARRAALMLTWIKTVEVLDARPGREVEAWHVLEGAPLPVVPAELQRSLGTIVADPSGACCRHWFRTCGLKAFAAFVRQVALVPDGDGWLYSWGDLRARQTVAWAALMYGMKQPNDRTDHWCYHADGMTREFIGQLIRDPHGGRCSFKNHNHAGQCVSRNKLTGTYGYGGNWNSTCHERGNQPGRGCGIVRALRDVGAVTVPHNYVLPRKYGLDGDQPNAYWLLVDVRRSYRATELLALREWEFSEEEEDLLEAPGIHDSRGPPV